MLVDHGDNTASGGTQDVMSVIDEVMRQGLDDVVAGPICDPASVARILAAGTAASVTLPLGGKIDMPQISLPGKPLTVTGKVARITDGEFVVTGPMATGTRVRMGRTAVLDTGAMQIVVSERRSEPFDLGVFTHCGIDPRRKRYVLIKSRQHFRAGFEPIARHIVLCDGDGCTSSDLTPLHLQEPPAAALPLRGRVMRGARRRGDRRAAVPRRARRQPPAARRAAPRRALEARAGARSADALRAVEER